MEKIDGKKEVSVVFLGGSITEGTGATASKKRWASLVQNWLECTFQEYRFLCHNKGIGGTDSEFGVIRLEKDVLLQKPDIVFVEFAVNDYGKDPDIILNALEGIVRGIWKENPHAKIIFVITAMYRMEEECYSRHQRPQSVKVHEKVANHYGIPIIFAGESLLSVIRKERIDPVDYLPDLVHPNDKGHAFYAQKVIDFLKKMYSNKKKEEWVEHFSEPMGDLRYDEVKMIDAVDCATVFRKESGSLCGRYQGYIESNQPGEKGELTFSGSGIGVYWMVARDSGNICFRIDDGEWRKAECWDTYALRYDRCAVKMLARGLKRGKHHLEFYVSREKEERATGYSIRIGAFLVV